MLNFNKNINKIIYPSDYHVHTEFSADSEADIDEVIQSAIRLKMESICITDHLDFDYVCDDILFEIDKDEYFSTLYDFKKKYESEIKVLIGIETGLEIDNSKRLDDFINRHDYDFIIGSSHLVNGVDPYYSEYFENRTEKDAFIEYFESIISNIKTCKNFDVYGHIDYVLRYSPNINNNFKFSDYKDVLNSILSKLIENGKGIEINTGGLRSRLKETNPSVDIIKLYKNLGGEIITIGSDAHFSNDVGYGFKAALEILRNCGFKYYTTFEKRSPIFNTI